MSKRPHHCGRSADRLAPELRHRNTSRPRRRQARVHRRRRRDAFGHRVPAGTARDPRYDVPAALTRGTSPGCALELEVKCDSGHGRQVGGRRVLRLGPEAGRTAGAIVEVTLGTAAHIGEVLAIRRRDIDLAGVRPTTGSPARSSAASARRRFGRITPRPAKSLRSSGSWSGMLHYCPEPSDIGPNGRHGPHGSHGRGPRASPASSCAPAATASKSF